MVFNVCILVFLGLSIKLSVLDVMEGKIPRYFFVVYQIFYFIYLTLFNFNKILPSFLCGFYAFCLFFIIRFMSKNKLGLADVWYAIISAETFTFFLWHIAMLSACFFAGIYIILSKKQKIPFIPFMSLGCSLVFLFHKA